MLRKLPQPTIFVNSFQQIENQTESVSTQVTTNMSELKGSFSFLIF